MENSTIDAEEIARKSETLSQGNEIHKQEVKSFMHVCLCRIGMHINVVVVWIVAVGSFLVFPLCYI